MLFSRLSLFGTLLSVATAWEATFYNAPDCDANGLTIYRIMTSDAYGACVELDGTLYANVECRQYINGGASNSECTDDNIFPISTLFTYDGTYQCRSYYDAGCKGLYDEQSKHVVGAPYQKECATYTRQYKSFGCTKFSS
ncbi:hypothetical protein J3E72DRAFT_20380 [Bipolaris maydis]|nr:hypothetical protein J3E72DRAFT_20380 [Bipolaris maydis]KAJ6287273.1 hypothetical protein J3E71DRAFT_3663 [Bipolaris maydis]